jgi:hypothetical protein
MNTEMNYYDVRDHSELDESSLQGEASQEGVDYAANNPQCDVLAFMERFGR